MHTCCHSVRLHLSQHLLTYADVCWRVLTYAHMQSLIIHSQTAFVPQMVEWAHKLKQDYWT